MNAIPRGDRTLTNWAGSITFGASRIESPESVESLQELVSRERRVRALGTRHSFTDLPDTEGVLISLDGLPPTIEVDARRRTVTVGGGVTYGVLAETLHEQGWALANMASLPHISVAGAVATGTHGSGDLNGSLATCVRALELVGPDGTIRQVAAGESGFEGSVVALGALGVVTRMTLVVEPAFDLRQDVYTGLSWEAVEHEFDAIMSSAYSVSLFTDWVSDQVDQVWLKSRDSMPPTSFHGAERSPVPLHMLRGAPPANTTEQLGVLGPWHERLPHFRMGFTPSRGEELQSEYLVPRPLVSEAIGRLRTLGSRIRTVLQVSEIRTVAADDLWLSGGYQQDVVGVHFTWLRRPREVYALLPEIEAVLLPLGARPHWGKCFVAGADQLERLYPRWTDFAQLRLAADPQDKFGNAFLDRALGPRTPR